MIEKGMTVKYQSVIKQPALYNSINAFNLYFDSTFIKEKIMQPHSLKPTNSLTIY